MGFGTVAAQMIMFISLLSVATGVVLVFDQHAQETTTAMTIKSDALANNLKTDFVITNVWHNSTLNFTYIDLLNTGATELVINQTDVIIDGVFIPRDEFSKNLTIIPSTSIRNPLLWDPKEVLEITVNRTLSANTTHILDVITEYGVSKTETFSFS